MEKVNNLLYQLQKSINSLKIDFQLLERLKSELGTIKMQPDDFEQQIRLLLQIYDLSNNQKLYKVKKTTISMSEMAVQLKILVCHLMFTVIGYFEKQQSITSIPIEFLAEGIQIMILSTRVCLNQGHNKFVSELQDCYKFIHSPYEYVSQFLPKNVQFFHQLNTLELIRYKCQNQSFSIMDFQKRLAILTSYQEFNILEYQNFISNIIMQIILKCLKNGKLSPQKVKAFSPYLLEQNQKDLTSLIMTIGNSTKNIQTSSQFLEIYNQIQNYGIQNINMDYLEQFIKKQKNFNDQRIFQIAALTLEPQFLDIWFSILNNKKDRSPSLQRGFMCYIHIVESILGWSKDKKPQRFPKLLKLSNTIIFTLLTQKKSTNFQQPVLNIIKTLMKVLTQFCFSMKFQWKQINDYGERIVLLCSRFQCMQITKVIYTLLLYCSLIQKQNSEGIYQKFLAHYNNDQSNEIFKLLSSAYLFRNSHKQNLSIEAMKSFEMFKNPFIIILFAQNDEDMTIFNIEYKDFKEINNKFLVYFQMIKKYENNEQNINKILQHLENFILKTKLDELNRLILDSQEEKKNLQNLLMFLVQLLQLKESNNFRILKNPSLSNKKNQIFQPSSKRKAECSKDGSSIRICFILIHLLILSNNFIVNQLKQTSTGVLLNKYSQKIKLITGLTEMIKKSKIQIQTQLYNICCCYLIIALQRFKKSFIKKQRIGEPGQVSFIHAISDFICIVQQQKIADNQQQQNNQRKEQIHNSEDLKNTFISFIIFEIDCLTNNHQKYTKFVDQMQTSQLRTYTNSVYIPKTLKQKILRRIVRQNLMENGSDVSLRQFKEIIQITEDQQELQLYIKYVFCSYGQEGKKMLLLIAHQNKRLQRILLNQNDVEI